MEYFLILCLPKYNNWCGEKRRGISQHRISYIVVCCFLLARHLASLLSTDPKFQAAVCNVGCNGVTSNNLFKSLALWAAKPVWATAVSFKSFNQGGFKPFIMVDLQGRNVLLSCLKWQKIMKDGCMCVCSWVWGMCWWWLMKTQFWQMSRKNNC